ncbi:class III lanthipeptide [Candidatus Galacturonibacter soehngenii]|nr:class III lanthipeptide [Candidatus Galacturonibacter soehngenii]
MNKVLQLQILEASSVATNIASNWSWNCEPIASTKSIAFC